MNDNYMPIGFHLGSQGNPTGIGDYMRILDAAGIPFGMMSADHYGHCFEAATIARQSGVPHNIAYRITTNDDLNALYPLDPEVAVGIHWQNLSASIPPEYNKDLVWLILVNEPNKEHADWLGRFGVAYANILLPLGYKFAMFGWSTGEPEVGNWEEPGVIKYLELCAQHPDRVAIALHEYSLDVNDIQYGYPYLVGRFMFLHDLCDDLHISRPTILISEWGWTYNDAPSPEQAMLDIAWAADLYSPYPNIKMVNTWYLGGGYGNIHNEVQPLIAPTTQFALTYQPPIIPLPPDETLEEHLWRVSEEAQCIHLYPDAALQKKLDELYKNITETEQRTTFEGVEYALQGGEGLYDGIRVVAAAVVPEWHNVFIVSDPAMSPPIPGSPLNGLILEPPFRLPHTVLSPFNAPRPYGNGLHEGIDVLIPRQPADSKEPVLNIYDGEIFKVRRSTGAYYNYVVIEHENNGSPFFTWHAHLDDIFVVKGQLVPAGHLLAELGGTGGPWIEHDHINLQVPGYGLAGYVIPDVVDPFPYLTNVTPNTYDLLDYLRGDGRIYDVKFLATDGSEHQERFQTQLGSGSIFYQTKNQHWEELWHDDNYIWRGTDTSPGQGKYYTLSENEQHGSKWIEHNVTVGRIFERNPLVTFFWKSNCQQISQGYQRTWIRVEAHYQQKTFFTGKTINDVLEFTWLATPTGPILERYFYAKGYGLVGWEGGSGHSAIKIEYPPGTTPDNVRETIPCL